MTMRTLGPINILLVEDNAGDVFLIQSYLRKSTQNYVLHHVEDGEIALAFLRREAMYREAPSPQLIILDLNLPRKDGREVLAELKSDPQLKIIPVLILTGSAAEQDIVRCYQLHANCYFTKPTNLDEFGELIMTINDLWLEKAQLSIPKS